MSPLPPEGYFGDTEIKAGKLFSFEFGEYSDHTVVGMFVALKDFNVIELYWEWIRKEKARPGIGPHSMADLDTFLAELIAAGLLLEVDYQQAWFSSSMVYLNNC